jgi:hypothetical protein
MKQLQVAFLLVAGALTSAELMRLWPKPQAEIPRPMFAPPQQSAPPAAALSQDIAANSSPPSFISAVPEPRPFQAAAVVIKHGRAPKTATRKVVVLHSHESATALPRQPTKPNSTLITFLWRALFFDHSASLNASMCGRRMSMPYFSSGLVMLQNAISSPGSWKAPENLLEDDRAFEQFWDLLARHSVADQHVQFAVGSRY